MVRPPAEAMRVPTWVDPVKLIMSTSVDSTRAAAGPASAEFTRLTTPGGNPTSSRIRTSSTTVRGSWAAGFTTTVLPMASAGATLPGHVDEGEVVRRDAGHHADGLAQGQGADEPTGGERRRHRHLGRDGALGHRAQVERVPLEPAHGDGHLEARPHRGGGAGLGDHEGEQLLGPGRDGLGGPGHEGAPLGGRGRRPRRQRLSCRRRGRLGVGDGRVGGRAHDLFGGGVDHVVGAARGVDPFAADEELALVSEASRRRPGHGRRWYRVSDVPSGPCELSPRPRSDLPSGRWYRAALHRRCRAHTPGSSAEPSLGPGPRRNVR